MSRNPPHLLCHLHLCIGCSPVCGLPFPRLLSHLSPGSRVSSCVLLRLLLFFFLDGCLSVSINPCCSALETTRRCKRSPQSQFHCHNPANKWADASHWMGGGGTAVSECHLVPFTSLHQFLTSAPHSPSLCPGPSPTSVSLVLVQPALPGLVPCTNHIDVWLLWAGTTQSDSLETQCPRGVLLCCYQESNSSWAQRLGQGWFLNVQVTESAYRMSETMLAPFTELHLWNILHRIHVCLAHTVPGRMNRQHGSLGSSA